MFLVPLVVFLGVKFGFRKSCLCKRNDKYKVCEQAPCEPIRARDHHRESKIARERATQTQREPEGTRQSQWEPERARASKSDPERAMEGEALVKSKSLWQISLAHCAAHPAWLTGLLSSSLSGSLVFSLALTGPNWPFSGTNWLPMVFCSSHSCFYWLSLPLSGSLWLTIALKFCS